MKISFKLNKDEKQKLLDNGFSKSDIKEMEDGLDPADKYSIKQFSYIMVKLSEAL